MNAPLTLAPRSSLGSKYLMALTGFGLLGFVIAHMLGNWQVFLGPEALNSYAAKLKDMGPLLWVARLGLLALFLAHIGMGIRLTLANRAARPIPYQVKTYRQATLASRSMLPTGLVILAFVLFHLAHYTFCLVDPSYHSLFDSEGRHDVYRMTVMGFQNPIVSGSYLVAMLLLAFHLAHGFQSLFQSLGLSHPNWVELVRKASIGLAVVIFVGNASMPLAVLFGLVGGTKP